MMRPVRFIVCAVIAASPTLAHADPWQPSLGHVQIPLWPGAAPDAKPAKGPEQTIVWRDRLIAGRPWVQVAHVSQPTMTVYAPTGKNTGAAIVVFPGGGYWTLAIDLEGTEVCDWLTSIGVTCVLLKYRVPGSGPHWNPELNQLIIPKTHTALQDAQRGLGLLRHQAAKWKIDPNKIGVLGFSAGGHLAAAISTHFEKRSYPAVDAADSESCRPDFAVVLYPGHLSANHQEDLSRLNPEITVTSRTPPTFLLHAQDDPIDPVEYSLLYFAALRKEKVPVEMHVFSQGGHAFGLRRTELPVTTKWPELTETWLKAIGMISN